MSATIVVDAYYFLNEIFLAVVQGLAEEYSESELLDAITKARHKILVTDRATGPSIKREYFTEATKRQRVGFGPQLVTVLNQLRVLALIVEPNLPHRAIHALGRTQHKIFIEDAVTSRAKYFVTKNKVWHRRDSNKRICPNLTILPAPRFIRIAGK